MYGDPIGVIGGLYMRFGKCMRRLYEVRVSLDPPWSCPKFVNKCTNSVQKSKDEEKTLNQNRYIDIKLEFF